MSARGVYRDELVAQSLQLSNFQPIVGISHTSVTLSPASVAAQTSAEQTFTLTGLNVGDKVSVAKPTNQAGLGIVNARVSAANTLAITFMNATAVAIVPTASETYQVSVVR